MEKTYNEDFHENNKDKEVDWSALPDLVLSLVADKVLNLMDYTRFGAVSSPWYAIYNHNKDHIPRDPLLLMLPDENDKDGKTRILYSFNENRVYENIRLSVPHNEFCPGSSHGWLVLVSNDFQVRLLNPFLSENNEIKLPPLTAFEFEENENIGDVTFLQKVVLSANPISNSNYTILALHGGMNKLSFYKAGDKSWTCLKMLKYMADIIYDNHKFYVLQYIYGGKIFSCDLNGSSPVVQEVVTKRHEFIDCKNYLVKSGSEILQVTRDYGHDYYNVLDYHSCSFNVLKLDPVKDEWFEVKTLDGRILFLGDSSSLSLDSSDMPGCKPNSIYFTDDNHVGYFGELEVGPHDMGVFDLMDHSFHSHYQMKSKMIKPAPIMIQPTLNLSS